MRHSSGRRGQVEPLAAIVAVATVGVAIGLYAGVLDGVVEPDDERDTDAIAVATLSVDGRRITVGPAPSDGETMTASRRVAVRTAPGVVRPGRLSITVWR
ncbi:hypothetical protein BRC62_00515 [Halobacteriales archaeon QH_10_67_13]|nr:MAG: hypothetical protein BRC62_00515 [Halobacteriales archaeon QH_10_67_13]